MPLAYQLVVHASRLIFPVLHIVALLFSKGEEDQGKIRQKVSHSKFRNPGVYNYKGRLKIFSSSTL